MRLDHQAASALGLLAVGQQAHPRALDAEHGAREGGAHECELLEVLAARLGVGADIEQRHGPGGRGPRNRQRQRGPVDAAGPLDVEQARRQRSAGPASAHERLRPVLADGSGRLHDRSLRTLAGGAGRVGALGDRHRRVHHVDHAGGCLGEGIEQLVGRSEQEHARAARGGERCPGSDLARTEVGAVAVHRHNCRLRVALVLDCGHETLVL